VTRRAGAAALLAVAVLSGCTTTITGVAKPAGTTASQPAGFPTTASDGEPVYDGPPSDAPDSRGALTSVRAVDLTPALPGVRSWADAAVPRPDGGAYVALHDADYTSYQLATVTPDGAVSAVQVPTMDEPDLFVLDDGRVVLAGQFWAADQGGVTDDRQYGFQVVDPRTGQGTNRFVLPPPESVDYDYEHAALSPDGRTLYLYIGWVPFETHDDPNPADVSMLLALDVDSGKVLAQRDLADDLDAVSAFDSGVYVTGVVPRPDGGVSLLFNATPSALDDESTIPTLFFFDDELEPEGDAVRLTGLDDQAESTIITGTPDGTVFALLQHDDRVGVVATPDGGGAGTELAALSDSDYGFGLAVEPAQEWALIYTDDTIQPLDLTSGELGEPLALNCEGQGVRDMFPGRDDVGALMVGECDSPGPRTQYLWFVTGQ
jgi:hypothetical protein